MWTKGEVIRRIDDIVPLVAQWEKTTHPAQVRLYEYLDGVAANLLPLPPPPAPLFLHLHIRANSESTLLHQYDVENFLTPLFGRRWIDPQRFDLVIGTKDVVTPSHLTVGIAQPRGEGISAIDWTFCTARPDGSASTIQWKEQLRQALAATTCTLPSEGPVECKISICCTSRRNWTTLWKPIGDAMGPLLGYTVPSNPYHPRDDRITHLEFHRTVNDALQWAVRIEYAWRLAPMNKGGA